MRKRPNPMLEQWRARLSPGDPYYSEAADWPTGLYWIPSGFRPGALMRVLAGDYAGWEHVSVSYDDRCPAWEEMCQVKDLFWEPEECVVQFHPPRSEYKNCHPFCLHLFRSIHEAFPRPGSWRIAP